MTKYRVKEVKKNGTSRFYPQIKFWGIIWINFTSKENVMRVDRDVWFLTKKRAWDSIDTYKRQNSPEEVTYHYD